MQLHLAVENSVAAASDDLVDTSRGDGLAGAAAVAALRGGALAEVHAVASFVLAQGKLSWFVGGGFVSPAAITEPGLPDPGLDSEADVAGAGGGVALLGALVVVAAVDGEGVGGGGASEGGDEEGGELHFDGFGWLVGK